MEVFFSNIIHDGAILLNAEESAHCVRVLRHRAGDSIDVIDGRGTLYHCVLEIADAKGASARITGSEPGFGGHPYRLVMGVCPTKNTERYEWFAEKATEVGVDVIAPVTGDRSERRTLKTERLGRIVTSAAKQSLKGAIPDILQPTPVRDIILSAPDDALKLICYCFNGPKRSIPDVLLPAVDSLCGNHGRPWPPLWENVPSGTTGGRIVSERREGPTPDGVGGMSEAKFPQRESTAGNGKPEIYILIGPEGDFSPEEAELALSRGWMPVSLGNSRLRTETAALVAVTQVYTCLGG